MCAVLIRKAHGRYQRLPVASLAKYPSRPAKAYREACHQYQD